MIVFQDFKYRQIFWITLPALFLLFTAQSYFQNGLTYTALYFIVNLCFVVFIFLTGVLLVAIAKKKSLKETFKTFTGIGDVLFFLVICTAFSPFMYLAYCAISAVVAILGYVAYNSIVKNATASSPFAGVMALSLIFLIVLKQLNLGFDFYDDEMIANILRFQYVATSPEGMETHKN